MPARLRALERLLGDPGDPTNPVGRHAVLDADERGEMLAAGEDALHAYGLHAEFVPAELGGRLTRLDHLVDVMRAVYRRDPCLGLGHGAASFIAAVNIWTAGDAEQRADAARVLCRGGRIAVGYHELAHGNDMARTEFTALPRGDRLVLDGRKEVITNARRADALVLLARTSTAPGSRSHSQVLVPVADVPEGRLTHLPRYRTTGMRGVQLGGLWFDSCPLPATSVLGGTPGRGLETALRSFQITRTTLVSMSVGIVDTALDTALRHVRSRRLYGRTAADLPHVRSVLTGVYVDLLTADCFATVATRALHLLPGETAIHAQAVKYVVSGILMDAMNRLSGVLGAHFYLREGPNALFQKLLRDIQPVGFGHAARAACQTSLLPQLPLLARRAWREYRTPPAALFAAGEELPPLDPGALALSAGGRESLSTSIAAGLGDLPDGGGPAYGLLRAHAERFAREPARLAEACAALDPGELSVAASPYAYDLTSRYTTLLTAAACVGTWSWARRAGTPELSEPDWAAAALHRLSTPRGVAPRALPRPLEDALWERLVERHRTGGGYTLLPRAPHHPADAEGSTP
ncbi:acyl-CoA dehydrogenase family protein [Streptomyces sp. NPDC093795]|uniref:acyl-CoA dehydrogenase family protein n=1 Tax=Streptomyces sp. NPDC093795 TaxID=3366051 RepID=UPI00381EC95C